VCFDSREHGGLDILALFVVLWAFFRLALFDIGTTSITRKTIDAIAWAAWVAVVSLASELMWFARFVGVRAYGSFYFADAVVAEALVRLTQVWSWPAVWVVKRVLWMRYAKLVDTEVDASRRTWNLGRGTCTVRWWCTCTG
jgi:hypothetical protein